MKKKIPLFYVYAIAVILLSTMACQQSSPAPLKMQEPAKGRVVVELEQGVHIGVNQKALESLKAYRSENNSRSSRFHIGRAATQAEIAAWDIHISPDGKGLPPGSGSVSEGARLYTLKCASCHGLKGEGIEPYFSPLVAKESDSKTIGSYWPYATTLFDYVRRAMPYNTPGSLTDEEVYSLTAFLLHANEIISEDSIIDATNLPKIVMPNFEAFTPDDREKYISKH